MIPIVLIVFMRAFLFALKIVSLWLRNHIVLLLKMVSFFLSACIVPASQEVRRRHRFEEREKVWNSSYGGWRVRWLEPKSLWDGVAGPTEMGFWFPRSTTVSLSPYSSPLGSVLMCLFPGLKADAEESCNLLTSTVMRGRVWTWTHILQIPKCVYLTTTLCHHQNSWDFR